MGRVPEHPAQAHPPRTGGWTEAEAPVAQRILSSLLIQWSRVRFPGKQLDASSLPWPPSEQGETSTVARWSQEDMVLGPKLAARPDLPTVQPTVRAKLNTAQFFARTHDRFQSPCAVSGIQNNFNPTRNSESAGRNAPYSVHEGEIRDIKCKTGQPNDHATRFPAE